MPCGRASSGYKNPNYAAPTKREWVGLTESEIVELVGGAHALYERLIVRDVEAKLKEKNCGSGS